MRVLIVTTWWPSDDQPGMGPFNVAHAKAIARHHDVHIVRVQRKHIPRTDTTDPSGLPLTTISTNPSDPLGTGRSLNDLRKLAKQSDVVHTMAYDALTIMAPLYPLIRNRWVHTEHWSAFVNNDAHIPARVKKSFRLPKRVSTVSHALQDALRPLTRDSAMTVIPNVIGDSFEGREQPSWTPLKLVTVGSLIDRKRPLTAVETVAELARAGEQVTLTWVGDGPKRAETERRAEELGVADRITLVGAVAPHEVPTYIQDSNLFFLPTQAETFLVAAAEALACGRPVVLPELPCVADYVQHGNGVLVPTDDTLTFAEAIRTARERFADVPADSIRATVLPRFGEATIADQFDEFYRGLEG